MTGAYQRVHDAAPITDRPLRLGLVMDVRSPWSIDVAISLSRLGAKCTIVAFDPQFSANAAGKRLLEEGISRLAVAEVNVTWQAETGNAAFNLLAMASLLSKLGRARRFDIILTLYGGSFAAAALLSGFRPYSIYWVGSDIRLVKQPIRAASAIAARCAALNIANGYGLVESARKRLGVASMQPLYIGIDPSPFSDIATREIGTTTTILCSRWFEPVYDNLSVTEAAGRVLLSTPGTRCVFTSSGSELEKARERWLRMSAGTAQSAMQFLGGVSRSEMIDNLRSADIFVSMSHSDGTSTALLEALAAGLYPVLSDIPANSEWLVGHGCDGTLVPVGDHTGLENALRAAVADPLKRRRAATRNRDIVARLADATRNHNVLLAALKVAASTPPKKIWR